MIFLLTFDILIIFVLLLTLVYLLHISPLTVSLSCQIVDVFYLHTNSVSLKNVSHVSNAVVTLSRIFRLELTLLRCA